MVRERKPERGSGWWLVTLLTLAHGALVALLATFRQLPRGDPPFVALLRVFQPWLFLPLAGLLPGAVATRSRSALGVGLVSLAAFFVLHAPELLPRSLPAPTPDAVSFMTFNLRHDTYDPGRLMDAIEGEGADVVAVVELAPDYTARIRERLSHRYPHMLPLPDEGYTVGLLSRFPIVEHETFEPDGGDVALHAVLSVEGRRLHALVFHPPTPEIVRLGPLPVGVNYRGREAQADALVERIEGLDGPAVLMGDFNMDERADAHEIFAGALRDAYEEVGPGFGFTWPSGWRYRGVPVPGPLVRLDYVFHTPDLRAEDAYRVCEGATDHCYVVARLGWR